MGDAEKVSGAGFAGLRKKDEKGGGGERKRKKVRESGRSSRELVDSARPPFSPALSSGIEETPRRRELDADERREMNEQPVSILPRVGRESVERPINAAPSVSGF